MPIVWTIEGHEYKSPVRVLIARFWQGREKKAELLKETQEELRRCEAVIEKLEAKQRELESRNRQLGQRVPELEANIQARASQPFQLPPDPSLPHHHYGARMISLSVNLSRVIGFHASEAVLNLFFSWLGCTVSVPHWTTIRGWLQRVGVAALDAPVEKADDWILMADHSIQLGTDRAFMVMGIRASQLPPVGQPLRHEDVRTLLLHPSGSWKQEATADDLRTVIERTGTPRCILIDGAADLKGGVGIIKSEGYELLQFHDFKHHAATILKSLLHNNKQFEAFNSQLGRTRAAIQQTELAHLSPPAKKIKARFMNLAATLNWASMVLWHLDHPASITSQELDLQRFEEKLGWLRKHSHDIAEWHECQQVISAGVTFINEHQMYQGVAKKFHELVKDIASTPKAQEVMSKLMIFLETAEQHLKEGERLPISTEIVESRFGAYKQLERQHSHDGFTSLLPAMAALQKATTPETIRRDFAAVTNDAVTKWVEKNLKKTVTSRRNKAYGEYHVANRATNETTTT
jgi:hypothetical protein